MPGRDATYRGLGLLITLVGLGLVASASASERRPVAAVTIYPNDVIREDMLTETEVPEAAATSAYAFNRAVLVGKVARRTLLPGQAIPTSWVGEPKLVKIGAMVRLVYEDGGLTIQTYATALQGGAVGDVVSVRNMESGITISGVIQADGSVHLGSG